MWSKSRCFRIPPARRQAFYACSSETQHHEMLMRLITAKHSRRKWWVRLWRMHERRGFVTHLCRPSRLTSLSGVDLYLCELDLSTERLQNTSGPVSFRHQRKLLRHTCSAVLNVAISQNVQKMLLKQHMYISRFDLRAWIFAQFISNWGWMYRGISE